MTVFKNSSIDRYTAGGVTLNDPCEVRIDGGSIAVSFVYEGARVVYSGHEIADGYFELRALDRDGRAILQRLPNDSVLNRRWLESRCEGMWRMQLDE